MSTKRIIVWTCIFSVAMAALESAVVVYLRALYYPDGFSISFRVIDESILQVEVLRELATLVMLFAIGYIAGRTFTERLAYFLLAFAVWDIFYYGWLKVLLNWPSSVFEWDVLFLIPFTWLAPVWAPLVCSLTMILLAAVLFTAKRPMSFLVWTLLVSGSFLILYTFMADFGALIYENGLIEYYPHLHRSPNFLEVASAFVPQSFRWITFWIAESILLSAIYIHYRGLSGVKMFTGYLNVLRIGQDKTTG